jgi:hypothetical protein
VSVFLSDQWFEELNSRLATSAPAEGPVGTVDCEVVFAVSDVPAGLPSALTLSISNEGVRVSAGVSAHATTIVRLSYDDAAALTSGRLDSATALREGRIKVRGDVNALVPAAGWLHTVLGD